MATIYRYLPMSGQDYNCIINTLGLMLTSTIMILPLTADPAPLFVEIIDASWQNQEHLEHHSVTITKWSHPARG